MSITYERVRELFGYRDDGYLIWKVRTSNRVKIGNIAGCNDHCSYCLIGVDGKIYRSHRLIWLWHHGYMPEHGLDHRNRVKGDNRVENLRETSDQCNVRNTGNYKHNKSGVKGISRKINGKWWAQIKVNKQDYKLGYFDNFDEAVLTRLAAEQCLDWNRCDSASPAYRYALRHGLIKQQL